MLLQESCLFLKLPLLLLTSFSSFVFVEQFFEDETTPSESFKVTDDSSGGIKFLYHSVVHFVTIRNDQIILLVTYLTGLGNEEKKIKLDQILLKMWS